MDVVSCSSGGPSPVNSVSSIPLNSTPNNPSSANSNTSTNSVTNSNNGTSNGIMTVTPKVEHSPPQHYEPQRQTVLMWGTATSNSNNNSTRSPNTTPTSNGMYSEHLKLSNQIDEHHHHQQHHHHHHQNSHLKWNGNSKDSIQVYPIHQHHDGSLDPMYAQSMSHHGSHLDHLHQSPQGQSSVGHHGNQQAQAVGSSCEVWSPASYSQYQYFTYHHAPQHASTQ